MERFNFVNPANAEYIEQLYSQYQQDPDSVEEQWKLFFAGFELGLGRPTPAAIASKGEFGTLSGRRSDGTGDLVHSYRELGHFVAKLDPLGNHRPHHPLLTIEEFGFSSTADMDRQVGSGGFLGKTDGSLRDLLEKLQLTYSGNIGVEYMDIPDKDQRAWLQERMEPVYNQPEFSGEEKKRTLNLLLAAQEFEQFLHTKYIGQKRFSLEGGEAVIPLLETLIEEGANLGVEEVVMGMAHRGRLNVLVHTLQKPYELVFTEFEGTLPQEEAEGDGDVKYHKGYSNDRQTVSGKSVHLSLTPNPSHLELVDPVVEGIVRAKQQYLKDNQQTRVVPVLIHGEAAFAGQGIVPETLNLSELEDYRTGGTIHIIVNNQLGFTATAKQTRFTPYATDVAKTIQAPILHVNAEDPEAVVHAARLAIGFREQFKVDVMLDVWCFRKYGHNETDDPTFTQPLMYKKINEKTPIAERYAAQLIENGTITVDELDAMKAELKSKLEAALQIAREKHPREKGFNFGGVWKGMTRAGEDWTAKTAISRELIQQISERATSAPEGFNVHRKVSKLLGLRREMAAGEKAVDWGCAESWALGSLLLEGNPIRLTGQDCERGTFSHRHAVLHDEETGETYTPLQHLVENQADFTIVNTMLSELAVLGFEFGYSCADPRNLVIWEAQFGDFVNGAQPIIDQFISSSESKWARVCGLTLLLPHGYEGQGPEHSSARLERFLQLCAENNMQVCNPTSPAQYFHLLRRQIRRSFRKPLILMMPKSLLRDERSASKLEDFVDGRFQTVIADDPARSPEDVRRVVFSSGKVFYALDSKRTERGINDVALIRVEQLYPFPKSEITQILEQYPKVRDFVWVQEEPRNMGAWNFMESRLRALLPPNTTLSYRGRKEASSPATGSYKQHHIEEDEFLRQALEIFGSEPSK